MTEPEAKRRFQFSLRRLMVAVTLVAGLAAAWHMLDEPYRLQREAMAAITKHGASYKTEEATG